MSARRRGTQPGDACGCEHTRVTFVIGHRGAPSLFPEHSASSYRAALRAGASAVEPDVVPTRDGVLLIRHDVHLADTTDIADRAELASLRRDGDWFCDDLDWSTARNLRCRERLPQLRPRSAAHDGEDTVMRLRELVDLVEHEGRGGLVVEIKHDAQALSLGFDMATLLAEELAGRLDSPALAGMRIESFEAGVLMRLQERDFPGRRILLIEDADADALGRGEEGRARLTSAGLDDAAAFCEGISVRDTLLGVTDDEPGRRGRELVHAARERGLEVLTYTLRTEDEFLPPGYAGRPEDYWRAVAATGVDGVFADDPAAVTAALAN